MSNSSSEISYLLDKAVAGVRLTPAEGLQILQSSDLTAIGAAANRVTERLHPEPFRTYNIDRNINYTNACTAVCDFCAFYRNPGDHREGYLLPNAVIFKKIEETLAIGGTGVLMQGGHHPDLDIAYYEHLFRSIKERYRIHLHALSPPEVQHIARRSKLSIPDTLSRLRDAGLDSIPGGGGEILVDRVRQVISPKKTKSAEWLNVMRYAHQSGMSTTATMMYGHVETLAERVEHMRRIRDLQDETRGFRAFISWTFQPDNTELGKTVNETPTSFEYLLVQAISRLYFDNIPHIQSSWVTQGMKIGQVALHFGADDLGSIMLEENVVSSAGTTYRATSEDFCRVTNTNQTQVKAAANYPLPFFGLEASATYQNNPGIPIVATLVVPNSVIAPQIGRNLSDGAAGNRTVALMKPYTEFGDRVSQIDIRFGKRINFGRGKLRGMFDIYNLFNASTVLSQNNAYGASWQTPNSILGGRLFKFGVQIEY